MAGSNARSSAIAAAIILVAAVLLLLVMPRIVLAAGDVSPWLGLGIAVLFVVGFFAVFFLRARHQRRRDGR
jgi:Ca2+/Na+ antiporter